jgi:DNA-binding FrmR family transcriptional regulator
MSAQPISASSPRSIASTWPRIRRTRAMAHTIKEKSKLLASVRGAVNGLTVELLEDHIRNHVVAAKSNEERAAGADELIDVVRSYLK